MPGIGRGDFGEAGKGGVFGVTFVGFSIVVLGVVIREAFCIEGVGWECSG